MIHGITSGTFTFQDSTPVDLWSDLDGYPVSARNYAHTIFSYEEDGYANENIHDELDYYFERTGWHVDPNDNSVAVANDTTGAWPFVVRLKVKVFVKYHDGIKGWREKPYDLTDVAELMEPAVSPKVYIDCD